MRILAVLVVLLSLQSAAQQMSIGDVKQNARCAVTGVQGNVTLNCPVGVPRSTVQLLNKQFSAQLKDRDSRIVDLTVEINEWKERYDKLLARLDLAGTDTPRHQAEELLKAGKLEEAGKVLDSILDNEDQELDRIANDHFNRATLFELEFKPLQALPHFAKAATYRPDVPAFNWQYGVALLRQNEYSKAEPILRRAIESYRVSAKATPDKYLPDLAGALNDIGLLYRDTHQNEKSLEAFTESLQIYHDLAEVHPKQYRQDYAETLSNVGSLYRSMLRFQEAIDASKAALQIYRDSGKAHPQEYLPDTAATLNNLGLLYQETHQLKESSAALTEALGIYRGLAKATPQEYLPSVGDIQDNLGLLYRDSHQYGKSSQAFAESLQIRRNLVEENPRANLADLARTLNNSGALFVDMRQYKKALDAFTESLQIRRDLAKANPKVYMQDVAETLNNLGGLSLQAQQDKGEALATLNEALQIDLDLVKANPSAYPALADVYNNLGSLHASMQRWTEAMDMYIESLGIYRELSIANRQQYLPDVADVLSNLGKLSYDGSDSASDLRCREASLTFVALAINDPQTFAPQVYRICHSPSPR